MRSRGWPSVVAAFAMSSENQIFAFVAWQNSRRKKSCRIHEVGEEGISPQATVPGKICYLQHITTPAGSDDTYLDVTFGENQSVSGRLNLLPAEKDRLTGTYVGTWIESDDSIGQNIRRASD